MRNKVTYKGKEGVWRTLPNGVHIFIPNGSDLDTEISRMSDEDWSKENTNSEYASQIMNRITAADFIYRYYTKTEDGDRRRLKPAEYTNNRIRQAFETRPYSNPEMDELILNGIDKCVKEMFINDRGTNWFKTEFYGYVLRIQISIGTRSEMLSSIGHEVGHAIDYNRSSTPLSSSHIDPKYTKTMGEMMFEEMFDVEQAMDECERLKDIETKTEDVIQAGFISEARSSIMDMVQAVHGDKACRNAFDFCPHRDKYFLEDRRNPATELFAELTASLFTDKDATFYNIMKDYCPKTIEIYEGLLEEVKRKWNSKN